MGPNKYENYLNDLIQKTKEKKIEWEAVSANMLPFVVRHREWIDRAFSCSDSRGKGEIYFVSQIVPNYSITGGEDFDRCNLTVYIVNGGKIIKALDDFEVDENIISRLYEAIDDTNDEDKDFFKDFE